MEVIPSDAVLLLIDVQKGFDSPSWGVRNNPNAEINMQALLHLWRRTKRPVVHVRHMSTEIDSPLRPGQEGNDFKELVAPVPGERIEEKSVNSGFIGTGLESFLRENNFHTVIIAGLTTDHCVSTTTRMAGNLGFNTILVADATATFDRHGFDGQYFTADDVHACSLASLHGEFATVVDTMEIVEIVSRDIVDSLVGRAEL